MIPSQHFTKVVSLSDHCNSITSKLRFSKNTFLLNIELNLEYY